MLCMRIGVYRDDELEFGCIEDMLDKIEGGKVDNVDALVARKLRRLEETAYQSWSEIEAESNKGPLYKLLKKKEDGCEGIGQIRIVAHKHLYWLLGIYSPTDNRFVVFAAEPIDVRGKRTNPDFHKIKCPEVRARERKWLRGEGEVNDWKE